MAAALDAASSKATSPHETRFAVGAGNAVNSNVNDDGSGLDPIAANHFGATCRGNENIDLTGYVGQVFGLRVSYRHRPGRINEAVVLKQPV
jgi:hypothetical protein